METLPRHVACPFVPIFAANLEDDYAFWLLNRNWAQGTAFVANVLIPLIGLSTDAGINGLWTPKQPDKHGGSHGWQSLVNEESI